MKTHLTAKLRLRRARRPSLFSDLWTSSEIYLLGVAFGLALMSALPHPKPSSEIRQPLQPVAKALIVEKIPAPPAALQ